MDRINTFSVFCVRGASLIRHAAMVGAAALCACSFSALASVAPTKDRVQAALSTLERGWVPNAGQWDERARFAAPGFYGTTWVSREGELVHQIPAAKAPAKTAQRPDAHAKASPQSAGGWVLAERFVGGAVKQIVGRAEQPGRMNYFVGDEARHRSNLPNYQRVELGEVYPGIEVALQAAQRNVEKLFTVKPGAKPEAIRIAVAGAQELRLTAAGALEAKTAHGPIQFTAPVAYQHIGGQRQEVPVRYRLDGERGEYGFVVAAYDRRHPLVIDPLLQSTYLGGNDSGDVYDMAIDATLGVYVVGETYSSNFPTTPGAYDTVHAPGTVNNAFVARLNLALTTLVASTFLGDNSGATAVAIDAGGQIYVAGYTGSGFPGVVPGTSAQSTYGGGAVDGFVARMNTSLSALNRATYLGGDSHDRAHAIRFHPNGSLYVAGVTQSASGLPFTAGALDTTLGGSSDGFVTRLNPNLEVDGTNRSTYFGGSGSDQIYSMVLASNAIYVQGNTYSADMPGAVNANAGAEDAFIALIDVDLDGSPTPITRYFGGSGDEFVNWRHTLAIHPSNGDLYFCGSTNSLNLPTTPGAFQSAHAGSIHDAFVASANPVTLAITRATYFGGAGQDSCYGLVIHSGSGEVYLAGSTSSVTLPGTAGGAQPAFGGGVEDAFVARLSASLGANPQTTYLGGSGGEYAGPMSFSPAGELYVAGNTYSNPFPGVTNGAQATYGGGSNDVFISRLTADLAGAAAAPLASAAVPTLSPWGIFALALLLGLFGAARVGLGRRQ